MPSRSRLALESGTLVKGIVMRILLTVTFPVEKFNALVRAGTAGEKISNILETTKPEAVYFTEQNGQRTAMVVTDMADSSKIPALAEPWFLTFDAAVKLSVVMTPDDLRRSGLETVGKKWT